MRVFLLLVIMLSVAVATPAQQLIPGPVLLVESEGTFCYLTSLSLWEEGRTLVEGEFAAIGITGREVACIFRCGLSVEDEMTHTEEGQPLYWATNTEQYGCLLRTEEGFEMYTGEIGRKWDGDLNMYLADYLPLSDEGILQDCLGAGTLFGYLYSAY